MYVIFPAEDLVELTLARPRYVFPVRESSNPSTSTPTPLPNNPHSQQDTQIPVPILINHTTKNQSNSKTNPNKNKNHNLIPNNLNAATTSSSVAYSSSVAHSNSVASVNTNSSGGARGKKKKLVFRDVMANNCEVSLKDLSHPSLNEHLKNHNAATFKLVRTGKKIVQVLVMYLTKLFRYLWIIR
ncbi:uncharacterized protein LOC113469254 isoform X2 [Diaphorina citri]|uniref:Uncharacterized protein LOC113469254 isoform X1 n=1 Tax=Diaphorina citri TaxID=121845 RepID=A0A3Q0J2F2_DIACI|nr:uncharacterized protein LOC113469254 isoform X1 [Diaphorina citri]XP_026682601.1 uncharacterized protein LOC113469254 isoform X2 [Diaphorina citri]